MGVDPYYEDEHATIYHGDCREILPVIDWDVAVTDPPYGINADLPSVSSRPTKATGRIGGSVPFDDSSVPFDVHRLLFEAGGPIVWFGGAPNFVATVGAFDPPPDRVLIWAPKFTLSMAHNNGIAYRFTPIHTWRLPRQTPAVWDVIDTPTEAVRTWWRHPATKPVKLMRILVRMVGDGVIVDPFMGSGSTLRAAKDCGRRAIGIELDESYCEVAAKRLAQGVLF